MRELALRAPTRGTVIITREKAPICGLILTFVAPLRETTNQTIWKFHLWMSGPSSPGQTRITSRDSHNVNQPGSVGCRSIISAA